jgi:hypothetical protein
MGMVQQLLIPGVQDAEESDLRAQVIGVARDREQGLGAGAKQKTVDRAFVLQRQRREWTGQSENDMRVAGRKQLATARLEPAVARIGLALGAL